MQWVDDQNPNKGFQYLYLNDDEYRALSNIGAVNGKKISENCWQVVDIIGKGKDLGVENLRGSGMIAGDVTFE